MYFQATTYVLDGFRPRQAKVDVHIDDGCPALDIEGFSAGERQRVGALVREAIASSGLLFPSQARVRVRIAPSPLRAGGGEGLCLAIAVAVLAAFGQVRRDSLSRLAVAGNLRADGTIGPVRGALQIAEAVAEAPHLDSLAIASQSAPEAACAAGVEVMQLYSLSALRYIGEENWKRLRPEPRVLPSAPDPGGPDFAELRGLDPARRSAEIAVAGDHSLLLAAPVGAGQALLARRILSILPPLRRTEALEVLRIASAAQEQSSSPVTGRPFRAPHPSADTDAILGGGFPAAPGEVSFAHNGVLFFDRITRFDAETLRAVATARTSGRTFVGSPPLALPCSFFLLGSTDLCPCGGLGAAEGTCSCGEAAIARYRRRLAAASETFDMVSSYEPPGEEDLAAHTGEPSCAVRSRVMEARARQAARLGENRTNRQMSLSETEDCGLIAEAVDALNRALPYPHQAGRRVRVAQVARTVADLAGAELVDTFHLAEALDLQLGPRSEVPRAAREGEPSTPRDRPMDPGNSPGVSTSLAISPTT